MTLTLILIATYFAGFGIWLTVCGMMKGKIVPTMIARSNGVDTTAFTSVEDKRRESWDNWALWGIVWPPVSVVLLALAVIAVPVLGLKLLYDATTEHTLKVAQRKREVQLAKEAA